MFYNFEAMVCSKKRSFFGYHSTINQNYLFAKTGQKKFDDGVSRNNFFVLHILS